MYRQLLLLFCRKLKIKSKNEKELEYRLNQGMRIGKNCHLYSVETIDGGWPWLISIGDNVTVSTNVTILAHDASTNVVKCGTKLGRVDIGNNVFVGSGSIILCDTKVGNNVIIAAGSVVSHDLPSDGVYAGVPARRICSIEEYREKYVKLREERPNLSRIRAWDEWDEASEQEKQQMISNLSDGIGFI